MSNKPVQFKRRNRDKTENIRVDIDGPEFLFAPIMGSVALEKLGQANEVKGLFDAVKVLVQAGPQSTAAKEYRRFVNLDLEMQDLQALLAQIYDFGDPGESSASSTSSADDGANSKPTSNGSTPSTSTPVLTA